MTYPKRIAEAGFTIIELLVAMVLGGIILSAITTSFMSQQRYYNAEEQVAEMVQNARAAMDMISREARMAGFNPAKVSFNGITYSTSQLEIKADLDGDGTTSGTHEDITYTYDSSALQIKRKVGSGTPQPFVENIQAFTFAYLDSSGTATTTSANIRQIRVTITAKTAKVDPNYTPNSGYKTYTLTSVVTPKNLGL